MFNDDQATILSRMLSKVPSEIYKSEGTFIYDALSPISDELAQMYDSLNSVLNNAFGLTASDVYLDLKASEIGVFRKTGAKAKGTAVFTGTNGTVIPSGTIIETKDGLQFQTIYDSTISNEIAIAVIEAVQVGSDYNLPAGVITFLPIQITGVSSVTNGETNDGENIEDDNSLRQRYLLQMQIPATSGNISSYLNWAKEVSGIGDAKVYPRWSGPNTVKVVLLSSSRTAPSAAKLNEVAEYIEARRPLGADVTVEAVKEKSIDVKLHVILKDGGSLDNVPDQIRANVENYLYSISFTDNVVRYTKVSEAILLANDILDFDTLTINNASSNIQLNDDEIPTLGAIQLI